MFIEISWLGATPFYLRLLRGYIWSCQRLAMGVPRGRRKKVRHVGFMERIWFDRRDYLRSRVLCLIHKPVGRGCP